MRIGLLLMSFIIAFSSLIAMGPSELKGDSIAPEQDKALIRTNYIGIAYGRILLIRRQQEYGAIRFIKFWTKKEGRESYARYESFYQGDGTGDFSKDNAQHFRGEVSNKGLSNFLGSHYWKGNFDLECGPIKLAWAGSEVQAGAHFFSERQPQGEYGIELAPTPWKDISQINVFDSKIKWYRYDLTRPRTEIPIDELW